MESTQDSKETNNILNIPTAIVVAGAIVALAIIFTRTQSPSDTKTLVKQTSFEVNVKSISDSDHVIGNPNAKVKLIEYSDPSCPYCKVFHNTMRKIMSDYGPSGNVAWVYRSYPLLGKENINGEIPHPNAINESSAMECAGSLGGNEKFWLYANRLYEITPSVTKSSPKGLDQKELPKIAQFVGLNVDDFNNCLSTGKFKDYIEKNIVEGLNVGIDGTPSSIIVLDTAFPASVKEKLMNLYEPFKGPTGEYPIRISADSKMIIMMGALPIETIKATLNLFFAY